MRIFREQMGLRIEKIEITVSSRDHLLAWMHLVYPDGSHKQLQTAADNAI